MYKRQAYDRSKHLFVNAFWIRSLDDIYRISSLKPDGTPPTAFHVEHLTRAADGSLVPAAFYEQLALTGMVFSQEEIAETVILPSERSLTQLWERLPSIDGEVTYTGAQIQAAFYKKTVMPWLCVIALLAPAPFCVPHRRPLRVFVLFCFSMFSLFTLTVLLSMGHTLTQSQLLDPWLALVLPMAILNAVAIVRFCRMP